MPAGLFPFQGWESQVVLEKAGVCLAVPWYRVCPSPMWPHCCLPMLCRDWPDTPAVRWKCVNVIQVPWRPGKHNASEVNEVMGTSWAGSASTPGCPCSNLGQFAYLSTLLPCGRPQDPGRAARVYSLSSQERTPGLDHRPKVSPPPVKCAPLEMK